MIGRTTVTPSISVLIFLSSLSMNNLHTSDSGSLQLMVLIATGTPGIPGISAISFPFKKKPKTSLKAESTNSGYSSDAQTYSIEILSKPPHSKSNSKTEASIVTMLGPSSALRSESPAVGVLSSVVPGFSFGPITLAVAPEVKIIPSSKPIMSSPPQKIPEAIFAPWYLILETFTPESIPMSCATRSCGSIKRRSFVWSPPESTR
mmetsp:Transcript_20390/g.29496  ORF Transcript_20390/g.29496 Transcript_20390/m.29496 type:complete len:205 (-) Transcript_20390:238-852(-)